MVLELITPLNSPSAPTIDSHTLNKRYRMNLKLISMTHEHYAHSSQRIYVGVQQIVIATRNRVMSYNGEADVLVDKREELRHALFPGFCRSPRYEVLET